MVVDASEFSKQRAAGGVEGREVPASVAETVEDAAGVGVGTNDVAGAVNAPGIGKG